MQQLPKVINIAASNAAIGAGIPAPPAVIGSKEPTAGIGAAAVAALAPNAANITATAVIAALPAVTAGCVAGTEGTSAATHIPAGTLLARVPREVLYHSLAPLTLMQACLYQSLLQ